MIDQLNKEIAGLNLEKKRSLTINAKKLLELMAKDEADELDTLYPENYKELPS